MLWNVDDVMSLSRNGMPFAETLPTNDINALVFCVESTVILFYSNMDISGVECPRERHTLAVAVFLNNCSNMDPYAHIVKHMRVLVTVDGSKMSLGVFNIIMTNKSNRHIKIHSNHTMGMLCSCEDSQICTIHEIVMFDKDPRKGRDGKPDPDLYHVPTRNPRMGRLEVNTHLKKDFYHVQVNEVGPQHDYVHYRKPSLLDALVNRQTRHELERLLEENHDAFVEDERQIGTTPLIKMSIDTGDHLPIAKKLYALTLKHYNWVRDEIDKLP